ncbi:MAG TPA: hemin uptake protein HemP [Planctomycetaceae bacterium]|nr:hemin uptake protein HemP [Planctomycetaceae bacterium]
MSHPPSDTSQTSARPSPPIVDFAEIARGQTEVIIQYKGKEYRLKTTRNGGLILNR